MKQILKKMIPEYYLYLKNILPMYLYDAKRFYKYSSFNSNKNDEVNIMADIIRLSHSLEKGLTMPAFRPGFGVKVLKNLVEKILEYNNIYDKSNHQILHAVGVIYDYEQVHAEIDFNIDEKAIKVISRLKSEFKEAKPVQQKKITKEEFFSNVNSNFEKFSKSRASIRDYSNEPLDINDLIEAIKISQSAPSACNRQSSRVYIYTDKERIKKILEIQGGNRGFGHLSDKLIIITSSLGVWAGLHERYQSYIDGGIFAMNILYALHFKKIVGCILNCSISPKKDKMLRDICQIDKSENFIAMVSCGNPQEEIKIAVSKRFKTSEILKIVD